MGRRSHSIHLERGDDVEDLDTDEEYDVADAALRDAERVRRLAEGERPDEGVSGHRRSSSIAALTLEDSWDNDQRRNPVMVPLPDDKPQYPRRMSVASMGNRRSMISPAPAIDASAQEEELIRNPFELPGPPSEFVSKFDPKARKSLDFDFDRSESSPSLDLRLGRRKSLTESYYAEGSQSGATELTGIETSRVFAPNGVLAGIPSRPVFEDIPDANEYGRPLRPPKYGGQALRVARHELLRPKTLLMPSQLAGTEKPTATVHIPEGFMLGEKPLPADARASILNMGVGVPLSLAQRTFRSSLMVGGRRDDELFFRGSADREGEQYDPGAEEEDAVPTLPAAPERKPGKLYVSIRTQDLLTAGHKSYRPTRSAQNASPQQAADILR